jgi:hypothetical protein
VSDQRHFRVDRRRNHHFAPPKDERSAVRFFSPDEIAAMNNDATKIIASPDLPRRSLDEVLDAMAAYVDRAFRNLEAEKRPTATHLGEVQRLVSMATQLKTALSKAGHDADPRDIDEDDLRKIADQQ